MIAYNCHCSGFGATVNRYAFSEGTIITDSNVARLVFEGDILWGIAQDHITMEMAVLTDRGVRQ